MEGFKNDGSFMEMIRKQQMQEQQEKSTAGESHAEEPPASSEPDTRPAHAADEAKATEESTTTKQAPDDKSAANDSVGLDSDRSKASSSSSSSSSSPPLDASEDGKRKLDDEGTSEARPKPRKSRFKKSAEGGGDSKSSDVGNAYLSQVRQLQDVEKSGGEGGGGKWLVR